MKATGVDVHIGWFGYEGSLIDEVYRDKETREYVFRVNLKLRTLFELDQFTQVDWAVRRQLGGQPLAQWLHGFYASHGLNRFRRLLVRWEKKPANYIAPLHFARGLIAFRATGLFG